MPEIFAQDILNPMMLQRPIFDAIICDPPYGVKVCSKRKGLDDEQQMLKA